jgi:hypothetical protein
MKTRNLVKSFLLCSFAPSLVWSGSVEGMLKGFTDEEAFVLPLATTGGSVLGANWVKGVRIAEEFNWSIRLPIQMTFISEQDRVRPNQLPHPVTAGELPTIFGSSEADYPASQANQSWTNKGHFGDVNTVPFLSPEALISYKGSQVSTRFMTLPSMEISGHQISGGWFGLGAQQQLNRWIDPKLSKPLPVDLGLAMRSTWMWGSFGPKNYNGTLSMSGQVWGVDLLVGKTLNCQCVEFYSNLGFEGASLKGSGLVTHKTDPTRIFNTNKTLTGENGFKIGLGIRTSIPGRDHWKPSANFGVGAQNTLALDILHN